MIYIVKISAKDENEDTQYMEYEVDSENITKAIAKSIDSYYEKNWTNTNWRKDEFDSEIERFEKDLKEFESKMKISPKEIYWRKSVVNDYKSELRKTLGCTDISIEEFKDLPIDIKVGYLEEIGCNIEYFVYVKNTTFEKVKI